MKKAGKTIAIVLMGMIIVMNLLTMAGNLAGKSGDFSLLPYTLLTVETGSMEPEISAGDLVIAYEVPYEDIKVGDTVTFEENGEYITHRVVRFDGSCIVTQGLANNAEDKPFGPENYLGKVVKVIPGAGSVLRFFSNPWSLLCALIVLFGLFYGSKIADWLTKKKTVFSPVRLTGFLLAASFLFLTPTMTAAKYTVRLNNTKAVSANARYISSNMLSKEDSPYLIEGWTGGSYGLTTSVISGENLLKYNKTGQDLVYRFFVLQIASEGTNTYRDDYTVTIMPQDGTVAATEEEAAAFEFSPVMEEKIEAAAGYTDAGTFILRGSDTQLTTDNFNILLQGDDIHPLNAGDRIHYQIIAVTDYGRGYYMQMSASVTMVIYPQQDFIENQTISTRSGNAVVDYELMTGLSNGSGARNVRVSWDNRVLYLDEYENNAYEIIHNRGPEYYHPGDQNDHNAYIIMSLTAFSSVKLRFYKYDLTLGVDDIAITAALDNQEESEEVDDYSTSPTTTPAGQEPTTTNPETTNSETSTTANE